MKFPILVSYAYARKKIDEFRLLASNPNVDLLLDSGAFTAKNVGETILLDDYCKFLDEWKAKIFRYLALDVVGDPVSTESNLQVMLKAGYKPVPVHVLGDDEKRMDELFELSDYVACAGLRRPNKGGAPREYVAAKMKWARNRNVHWLGYVREPMIALYRPYSCDSASWMSAGLYGVMDVYLGRGQWRSWQHKDVRDLLRCKESMRIIKQLGYTSEQLIDENCWRRAKSIGYDEDMFVSFAVSVDSWIRYVLDINKRYGTRVFLATTMVDQDMFFLTKFIQRYSFRMATV